MNLELRGSLNTTTVVYARMSGERWWRMEEKCRCIVSRPIASAWKHIFCRDKHVTFVATKIILVAAPANDTFVEVPSLF